MRFAIPFSTGDIMVTVWPLPLCLGAFCELLGIFQEWGGVEGNLTHFKNLSVFSLRFAPS